jgi:hypothetical protein
MLFLLKKYILVFQLIYDKSIMKSLQTLCSDFKIDSLAINWKMNVQNNTIGKIVSFLKRIENYSTF